MHNFTLNKSIEILENTPKVLESFLANLSDDWINQNEGDESWSPFDIIGHLIHGEKTDWIPRAKIILSSDKEKMFKPFDRLAQSKNSKSKSIDELLSEFSELRIKNLHQLRKLNLQKEDLIKKGIHPHFGEVTLQQLLAAWVVHDLGHIRQITRVMAKQYKTEIGPWKEYLPVVSE